MLLESLEKINFSMSSIPKEKKMTLKMSFDFDSFENLDYLLNRMAKLSKENEGNQNSKMMMQSMNQESYAENYILSKKNFIRKEMDIDTEQFKEMNGDMEDFDPEDEKTQMMMKMFFGDATYSTVYHFPKKIKSTNIENAKVDGKTISVSLIFDF